MNTFLKYLVGTGAWLAVLYPLWVAFNNRAWAFDYTFIPNLFPMLGMLAFCLLWLHSISGVFEPWLRRHFQFDRFVQITASIILVCILLHPLLLFLTVNFNINTVFFLYGAKAIWLAIIGWLLLLTYDIGKALKKIDFFKKKWQAILIISNIGFLLTFLHSIEIGGDVQQGPLRFIWIFYGATAFLAVIYTYAIMPYREKREIS